MEATLGWTHPPADLAAPWPLVNNLGLAAWNRPSDCLQVVCTRQTSCAQVTLVWTDPPAEPAAARLPVRDLGHDPSFTGLSLFSASELACERQGWVQVTLVWTDPPADLAAARQLVNDLDLTVNANSLGGYSLHGNGAKDYVNNVEQVRGAAGAQLTHTLDAANSTKEHVNQVGASVHHRQEASS